MMAEVLQDKLYKEKGLTYEPVDFLGPKNMMRDGVVDKHVDEDEDRRWMSIEEA